jgi:hypothetical protein
MIRIPIQLPLRTRLRRRPALVGFAIAALCLSLPAPGVWAQTPAQSSLQRPAGLDARDAQGLTPLVVAASAGHADAVRSLLAQGAGINATSADGRTALIAAVQSNQIEVVQALIAAGANLNAATRGTGTALEVAELKGETQIAALLLAFGARSSGKSVGDTVCVRPWGGDGFCGTVKSFTIPAVQIQVTRIVGCANGCPAKEECSASRPVGGANGLRAGNQIAVPSWCLTHTGVKP